MLDTYFSRQNKFLAIMSAALFLVAMVVGAVIFVKGHPFLALVQLVVTLSFVAGSIKIICQNIVYVRKWNAINEIDQSSFHYDEYDGVSVMKEGVGTLDFKFTKDDKDD